MGIYQRENGRWCISYSKDGKRIRRTVGSRKEAEAELKRLKGPTKCDLTLNEYALGVIKAMTLTHSPNTVKAYGYYLQALTRLGNPRLDAIDLPMIRDYQVARIQAGKAPATANREVIFLSKVLSQAVQDGHLSQNPLTGLQGGIQLPEPQGRLRFLSLEEIVKLEDACGSDPLLGIVQVAVRTGLRMREIFQLQWAHLDLKAGYASVLRKHKRDYSQVPLGPEAVKILKRQPRTSTFVFPGRGGGQRDNCKKAFSAAVKRAGLKDVTFHTLRHSFASHAVMEGMDLRSLQEILGHSKLDMVMRYAHLADEHKASQIAKLEEYLSRLPEGPVTE